MGWEQRSRVQPQCPDRGRVPLLAPESVSEVGFEQRMGGRGGRAEPEAGGARTPRITPLLRVQPRDGTTPSHPPHPPQNHTRRAQRAAVLPWALAANVSPQIAAGVGAPKQPSSSERHPWVLGMGGVQGGAPHAGEGGRHRAGSIPGAGGCGGGKRSCWGRRRVFPGKGCGGVVAPNWC